MSKRRFLLLLTVAGCQTLVLCFLYMSGAFTCRPTPMEGDVNEISRSKTTKDENESSRALAANVVNSSTAGESFTLMELYQTRYAKMKVKSVNMPNSTCPQVFQPKTPACWMPGCNASFPPSLAERLQRLLRTQHPLTASQSSVIGGLSQGSTYVDVAVVTAASANHFWESQGLIRDLHESVFPELKRQGRWTFRLFYYDLGLAQWQLKQLKEQCHCTVLPFPFSQLPAHFLNLGTCVWKPLLIKAHLGSSRFTLWMDASTRLTARDISPILQQTDQLGIFVARNNYMFRMHVHAAMMSYFQVDACPLTSFYETAGGFVALHNDVFVQRAVLDPWVACAFSPKCLCPMEVGVTDCYQAFVTCKVRENPHFLCHRFDQSGLGIILTSLFDWRTTHLMTRLVGNTVSPWFSFKRGHTVRYFQ